jgi:G3E family GTPase
VDAVNLEQNLAQSNEAVEQVAFSDIILVNKMDLVSPERMAAIESRVRQLNPMAKIYHTANAEIDLADILNVRAFDLVQKLEVDPEFLDDHEHEHDAAIGSFVLEERRPIDINRLMIWMNGMAQSHSEDLYRTKGIFYANGFQERLVFQSVRMLTTLRRDRPWGPDEDRMTQFVVIGKHFKLPLSITQIRSNSNADRTGRYGSARDVEADDRGRDQGR